MSVPFEINCEAEVRTSSCMHGRRISIRVEIAISVLDHP